jgi:hypothetical protein
VYQSLLAKHSKNYFYDFIAQNCSYTGIATVGLLPQSPLHPVSTDGDPSSAPPNAPSNAHILGYACTGILSAIVAGSLIAQDRTQAMDSAIFKKGVAIIKGNHRGMMDQYGPASRPRLEVEFSSCVSRL